MSVVVWFVVLNWQVRILRSLFPPMLLQLYKLLIAPIQGGKVAAIMVGLYFLFLTHFIYYYYYYYLSLHIYICICDMF